MPPHISIVVIDPDADSLKQITDYILKFGDQAKLVGTAVTFDKGFEIIHKTRPMVVVMAVCEDVDQSIERIKTILSRFPLLSVFATCPDKSSDTILKVMRAGATEYLLSPVVETDLAAALQKLGRLWVVKHEPTETLGRVYTVFSSKGGVGTTTLATNLAANIYNETKEPTVLVDLDLTGGDVTTYLNIHPSYTISDVTVNMSRLDKSFLQGVITKHQSGVYILAEPQRIAEGISISGGDIKKVIGLLKTMFKHIVIDTEPVLVQTTKAALEAADDIFLTFVLTLPGLKNTKKYIDYFKLVGLSRDKINIVINRFIKKGDIRTEDAEKILEHPVFYSLPNDYDTTMACINKGVILSDYDPKSKLNLAIKELTQKIITAKK